MFISMLGVQEVIVGEKNFVCKQMMKLRGDQMYVALFSGAACFELIRGQHRYEPVE